MPTETARLLSDPASILERFRDVFLSQWEELLRLRREVLKTSDLDDIHDLRVASRRFRAALRLFGYINPAESKTNLNKSVRKLTRVLGGLRNIDEALLFFKSRDHFDTSTDHQLCRILSEMRSVELQRIDKALQDFDHHKLSRIVRDMAAGLKAESTIDGRKYSLPAHFSDVSITLFQPIYDLLTVSAAPDQRESRHALRICIKKWRYFLEILAPVLGCDYSSVLGLLKEYQSILGRMNDVAEFGALCRDVALPPSESEIVEALLLAEDEILLGKFIELVGQKPLTYQFKVP
jgi:CHAD domain-containing protein